MQPTEMRLQEGAQSRDGAGTAAARALLLGGQPACWLDGAVNSSRGFSVQCKMVSHKSQTFFAGHNCLMLRFPLSTMAIRARISAKSAFCLDLQCGTPAPTGTGAACTAATTAGAQPAASVTPATAWRPTTRPVKVRSLQDRFHSKKLIEQCPILVTISVCEFNGGMHKPSRGVARKRSVEH